jgi:hypothetical protein
MLNSLQAGPSRRKAPRSEASSGSFALRRAGSGAVRPVWRELAVGAPSGSKTILTLPLFKFAPPGNI